MALVFLVTGTGGLALWAVWPRTPSVTLVALPAPHHETEGSSGAGPLSVSTGAMAAADPWARALVDDTGEVARWCGAVVHVACGPSACVVRAEVEAWSSFLRNPRVLLDRLLVHGLGGPASLDRCDVASRRWSDVYQPTFPWSGSGASCVAVRQGGATSRPAMLTEEERAACTRLEDAVLGAPFE